MKTKFNEYITEGKGDSRHLMKIDGVVVSFKHFDTEEKERKVAKKLVDFVKNNFKDIKTTHIELK